MNHEVFEEWFRCQLLLNIPPASVIVMDNAPYHSRKVEKVPTMSSKKAVITEWLISKGAKPTEKMLKSQLLEMVKEYSVKIKTTKSTKNCDPSRVLDCLNKFPNSGHLQDQINAGASLSRHGNKTATSHSPSSNRSLKRCLEDDDTNK
ncbi:uncharacterized protein [Macrobrachium rosenbergii]|uniref:uncharacterized protein n=1 Tax=Macrobrachium rosenbergii TaxID=79674 RepID=UPI0034D46432